MELDYSEIFSVFANLMKTAIPIGVFLYLLDTMINFFFGLAFPKRRRGDD